MLRRFGPSLLLVLGAVSGAVGTAGLSAAQECVLDRCLNARPEPPADPRTRGPVASGDFDAYILALSWSPGFCAVSASQRDRDQCESGARLGFVVHGLWPQRDGASLTDCEGGLRPAARADMLSARDLFPNESLARYQWRKHGGCTGLSPSAYFADVRRARAEVVVPRKLAEANERMTLAPEDVLRAFRDENPRLRPGMAAVSCPGGVLQEVRICMTKDLRGFAPCPEVAARSCRARQIEAPPPR